MSCQNELELSEIEDEDAENEEYHGFKEPSSKALFFWALMVVFALLILVCIALSVLFATPILQKTIPDATPERTTATFFGM